jgi:hypothetical protein
MPSQIFGEPGIDAARKAMAVGVEKLGEHGLRVA